MLGVVKYVGNLLGDHPHSEMQSQIRVGRAGRFQERQSTISKLELSPQMFRGKGNIFTRIPLEDKAIISSWGKKKFETKDGAVWGSETRGHQWEDNLGRRKHQ